MNLPKLSITIARIEGETGFPTGWFLTLATLALIILTSGYFPISFFRKKRPALALPLLVVAVGGAYGFYLVRFGAGSADSALTGNIPIIAQCEPAR